MSNPASCLVNSSVPPYVATASQSIIISLIDTAVDSWTISCTSTDDFNTTTAINAGLVVNQIAKTAAYTQPSTASGSALQFTSTVVTGGITSSVTFGVFVNFPIGTKPFFPGETNESNASFGVVADLNAMGRATLSIPNATSTTSGAIVLTHDLGGVYNVPSVIGIQGNPVKATTLAAAQDGYILQWKNSDSLLEFLPINGDAINQATFTSYGVIKLGGDIGNTASLPYVTSISGTSPIVITPANLQWSSGTTSPILNQATTTSGSGQNLTVQSQNATGVGNNGGNITISSGTSGSATAGTTIIQTGGNNQITITPSALTLGINTSSLNLQVSGTSLVVLSANAIALGTNNTTTTFLGAWDGYTNTINNSYAVDFGAKDYIILAAFAITHTITLPAPTNGRELWIKDIGGHLSSSIVMNIAQHSTEKIEGQPVTYAITVPYAAIQLVADGTSWWILN